MKKLINHHDFYKRLERIFLLEEFSGARLLAPPAVSVLEEYAERHGVGWLYTKLV